MIGGNQLRVLSGNDYLKVAERYREPIASMQDSDFEFPENVMYAYYALFNLFNKYVQKEAVDDWIIVNQALSAQDLSLVPKSFTEAIGECRR